MKKRELSIIIPAYNEEKSINTTVSSVIKASEMMNIDVEVIVVDDGSSDETVKVVRELENDDHRIRLIEHRENLGMGQAVMTGVHGANKSKGILIPADGQFNLEELDDFVVSLDKNDVVMGVRSSWGGYTLRRQIQSFVYIKFVNFLFNQCYPDVNWVQGWKIDVIRELNPESSGVFFLQEVIALAGMAGLSIGRIPSIQLPRDRGQSHAGKVSTILLTIWEALKFRVLRYKSFQKHNS